MHDSNSAHQDPYEFDPNLEDYDNELEHDHSSYEDEMEILREMERQELQGKSIESIATRKGEEDNTIRMTQMQKSGKRKLSEIEDDRDAYEPVNKKVKRHVASSPTKIAQNLRQRSQASIKDLLSDGHIQKHLPDLGVNYMPVTSPNGDRWYVTMRDDEDDDNDEDGGLGRAFGENSPYSTIHDIRNILSHAQQGTATVKTILSGGKTIEELLESVDRRRMHATMMEQSQAQESLTRNNHEMDASHHDEKQPELFVDKFAPSNFTDLLTNEVRERAFHLFLCFHFQMAQLLKTIP